MSRSTTNAAAKSGQGESRVMTRMLAATMAHALEISGSAKIQLGARGPAHREFFR